MLKLYVVDLSAESRSKLSKAFESLLAVQLPDLELVPRVSLRSVSITEFKFQSPPDICIVGPEICDHELTTLSSIRKSLPGVSILACVSTESASLASVDQVLRMGADDLFALDIAPKEFFHKLLIHSRKKARQQKGAKLVLVDSAKGGLGVTSTTAALGEALYQAGNRVCLIDLDIESQDLSRFIQARPYVNDSLGVLLQENRTLSEEQVEHCLVPLDQNGDQFFCMPPPPESQAAYTHSHYTRSFLSLLEILDSQFDVVLVDVASTKSPLLDALYHVADNVLYLVNNDPASFYATTARASKLKALLSPESKFMVLEIGTGRAGLTSKLLQEEFSRATNIDSFGPIVPFFKQGLHWPGSGSTLYSMGSNAFLKAIDQVVLALGFETKSASSSTLSWPALDRSKSISQALGFFARIKSFLKNRSKTKTPPSEQKSASVPTVESNMQPEQPLLSAPSIEQQETNQRPQDLVGAITFN